MKDGELTAGESAKLDKAQDHLSQSIRTQKHDGQTGNPDSASAERMQASVQRSANQEMRIQQGLESGSLSGQETARLEHGQAKANYRQARAGADGHVGAAESHGLQHQQTRQSARIHQNKHN